MANVYIKTAEGGENTNPDGTDALPIDDGTNSEWVQINNLFNGAPAQGDVVYFNGTKWARLAAGASGQVLKTQGAAANPIWDSYSSGKFEGLMHNGKLSVTVASNNLTVALKTWADADPSADDPVRVYINGNERSVTSALSVTLAAGTQWFALGTPFAALEQNFFAYLSWRAASSAVVIGISRIPYATLYSDFSATTTNEKHGAFSTAPASTDGVVVIGRFAATLSASYNWSVPTFTSANLIQKPVYETEWMYWLPAPTGYSVVPTNTIYLYKILGKDVLIRYREQGNGTSNANSITQTAPFTAQTITNGIWANWVLGIDNGSQRNAYMTISSGSATISCYVLEATTWTTSGGKRIAAGDFRYPISA